MMPKSCSGELIGHGRFTGSPQVLSPVFTALNTSNPPRPTYPLEEKYKELINKN